MRGIDPVTSSASFRQALDELASTSACTVVVEECAEPESADVARALWFCCAEVAANTSKHAARATLRIAVSRERGGFVARLTDDGPGGARTAGSGLRGLADRVETLGGSLRVVSPPGGGTELTIELPDSPEDCGQPQPVLPADADPLEQSPAYVRRDRHPGGTS